MGWEGRKGAGQGAFYPKGSGWAQLGKDKRKKEVGRVGTVEVRSNSVLCRLEYGVAYIA